MISRYTRPEMGRIWSEENSFQKWLDVEILAAEGLARMGKVPQAAISRIRRKARIDVKRIRAIEAEVKTVGFADESGKKNEFYWSNPDLAPDVRPKLAGKAKSKK